MQHHYEKFIGPKDCKYKLGGKNIAEFRRARLRTEFARPLKVSEDGSKNDILAKIISKLNALEAPAELTELDSFGEPES